MSRRLMAAPRPTTKRRLAAGIAGGTAAAVVLLPVLAAAESASPSPSASASAVTTTTSGTASTESATDTPTAPLPRPKAAEFNVGQSVQLRVTADGKQNGPINFRWSVTQVAAQGEDKSMDVKVPEQGAMLRSLNDFSKPAQENGVATYPVEVKDGFGLARSVSLVPQDYQVPVELKAEFTLDGQPISADDLVGKSGVVTARYTVRNLSGAKQKVKFKSVTGKVVEQEVDAMVPMVVEAGTLLPMRYTGMNLGTGMGGADGRGNVQVKWIGLPFAPLSPTGEAHFGWAANVTEAVIPSMLIQVLPIYIPKGDPNDPATPAKGPKPAKDAIFQAVPPPNVSDELAQAKAGVESLMKGLQGFSESEGGDPLQTLETGLNGFFEKFGTNIQNVAKLVDPENPQSVTAQLASFQTTLDKANASLSQVNEALTPEVLAALEKLAENWPQLSEAIQKLNTGLPLLIAILEAGQFPLDCTKPDPATPADPNTITVGQLNKEILVAGGNTYKGHKSRLNELPQGDANAFKDGWTYSGGATAGAAYWDVTLANGTENDRTPTWNSAGLPSSQIPCKAVDAAIDAVISSDDVQAILPVLQKVQPIIAQLSQVPALSPEKAAEVQKALQFLSRNLAGIVTTLTPLTAELSKAVGGLSTSLGQLNQEIETIGKGLEGKEVDLPAMDAVVSKVVADVLASPNGQAITTGLGDIKGGVGGVSKELSGYVAKLVVSLKTGGAALAEDVKNAAGEATKVATAAGKKVDGVKAEVAGMVSASHGSPLPYGGDPATAPEGTQLAGAYEFRVDAADHEKPSTPIRLLLGLAALIGAGFLAKRMAPRPAVDQENQEEPLPEPTG